MKKVIQEFIDRYDIKPSIYKTEETKYSKSVYCFDWLFLTIKTTWEFKLCLNINLIVQHSFFFYLQLPYLNIIIVTWIFEKPISWLSKKLSFEKKYIRKKPTNK